MPQMAMVLAVRDHFLIPTFRDKENNRAVVLR
jgi:hypothetical protein